MSVEYDRETVLPSENVDHLRMHSCKSDFSHCFDEDNIGSTEQGRCSAMASNSWNLKASNSYIQQGAELEVT